MNIDEVEEANLVSKLAVHALAAKLVVCLVVFVVVSTWGVRPARQAGVVDALGPLWRGTLVLQVMTAVTAGGHDCSRSSGMTDMNVLAENMLLSHHQHIMYQARCTRGGLPVLQHSF